MNQNFLVVMENFPDATFLMSIMFIIVWLSVI